VARETLIEIGVLLQWVRSSLLVGLAVS